MRMQLSKKNLIQFCCLSLIALIFLSKLSLKCFKIIPSSLPPLIFQYGIHPYINFGIQSLLSLFLIHTWLTTKCPRELSGTYKIFIYSLILILSVQTLLQMTLININYSLVIQLAGLAMAVLLILIYGIIIPSFLDLHVFILWTKKISVTFIMLSILLAPLFFGDMFKGGRFIGLFKNIPHMVTASTVAFIFTFPSLFESTKWKLYNNHFLKLMILFFIALVVLLTSTKAALGTIFITSLAGSFIFGTAKKMIRIFKVGLLCSFLISILFIGGPMSELLINVSTGKTNFGLRSAQDGIQSRTEEVRRGLSLFEKSPYVGLGLLYKFLNNKEEGIEVEGYNSFKDPHNLFISAAVIGGYPLLIYSILAYLFMIIGAIKGMMHPDFSQKILGLFLLSHLPVFIIYHAHFSLGGLADRIYWLIFGYLGLKNTKNHLQWETTNEVHEI